MRGAYGFPVIQIVQVGRRVLNDVIRAALEFVFDRKQFEEEEPTACSTLHDKSLSKLNIRGLRSAKGLLA